MTPFPDITHPRFKADPFGFWAQVRQQAPAVRVVLRDRKPAWLITRYPDVAAALKDPRLAKNPRAALGAEERERSVAWTPPFLRPLTLNMLDLDPPDHTRLRGLVHQAFTQRRVEQLRARIEELCAGMLARAKEAKTFDLIATLALPLPLWVIADLLGVPERDRMRFRRWSERTVATTTAFEQLLALPAIWSFLRYMRGLVARHRAEGGEDLLTALIRAEEQGDRLSDDELLAMVFLLLVAGHETTVNLIASGTLALLDHPDQLERLRAEPALIKPGVEELLRMVCPVDLGTERYSTEPYPVGDVTIPRGERVYAVIASANHDETVFPHPERLLLDRDPNRHLSFGQGAHYCLGAPLARLEAQVAIPALFRELPKLTLAVPRASLRWRRSQVLRGLVSLPVTC